MFQTVVITWDADQPTVTAFGVFGEVLRRRTYKGGSLKNRWRWARRQAREWADKFYLNF